MTRTRAIALIASSLLSAALAAQTPARLSYPESKKVEHVDDYHGTKVADPYRWLEDPNAADTQAWVEAQNRVTFAFLERIPARERIRRRLTELWNYERYGVPERHGRYYIYTRNDGLQNQAVLYKTARLDRPPAVLLDPNRLSAEGTVALTGASFSNDGRYLAYATSASGSDWLEWRVREVATTRDLPDVVKWSKFSGAAWPKDRSGFYYCRFAAPKEGEAFSGVNKNHSVYFHRLGASQESDELVYARADHPDWTFDTEVTDDGRFLLINQGEGTEPRNRVFIRDLAKPGGAIEPFLDTFDAYYTVVGNDGERFYVTTDQSAPRGRLVAIERSRPGREFWKELIPQPAGRDVLASVRLVGERFLVTIRTDAHDKLKVHRLDGALERDVQLPTIGSLSVSGKRKDADAFYAFTSFTYPTTIYRYAIASGASTRFKQPKVAFRPEDYETTQVFFTSRDGTRVPMFIVQRRGLSRTGANPALLYGYGGFDISMTPTFSPATIGWLEMGGIYAMPNLRGGGEYGREWHDAGRLKNKQNVFDDFIAAAEYLIRERYTSTPKLAIMGGSNGGLLVGAAITQRPDLFGAAWAAVGVMDMLRFHKFTIGWAWASDYGSSDTKDGFETLIKYSPLHNIKPGVKYPATLVTTADHDDRVVPAHSFKFIAALQAAQAGDAPVVARIETKAGHGAGKPTSKIIEERADAYAFLAKVLNIPVEGSTDPP